MNDAGALQDLLHDTGGLIPSSAWGRGCDDAQVLEGGLGRNGRRTALTISATIKIVSDDQ